MGPGPVGTVSFFVENEDTENILILKSIIQTFKPINTIVSGKPLPPLHISITAHITTTHRVSNLYSMYKCHRPTTEVQRVDLGRERTLFTGKKKTTREIAFFFESLPP